MEENGRVRIATLNLWGRNGAWEERRSVLVEGLCGLRPDVIAFQEAIVGDGYDQVRDVLGEGYYVVHQNVGLLGDGNHGASIASRWPLGEVGEADLHLMPRTGDYPCGTVAAEVLAPEPLGTLRRQGAWYHKAHPTFSDALALVRKGLWVYATFYGSPADTDTIKVVGHPWNA